MKRPVLMWGMLVWDHFMCNLSVQHEWWKVAVQRGHCYHVTLDNDQWYWFESQDAVKFLDDRHGPFDSWQLAILDCERTRRFIERTRR